VADRPNLTQQQIDRRFENVRMATMATTKQSANHRATLRS
jgi:hypothetical protein